MIAEFEPGFIQTQYAGEIRSHDPLSEPVRVSFPVRINAMAIDPSKIDLRTDRQYTAGEVVLVLRMWRTIEVGFGEEGLDQQKYERQALLDHGMRLVKTAAGFNGSLVARLIDDEADFPHMGLGSSSGLIAATAAATNEFLGRPLNNANLVRYLAANHGEETHPGAASLTPVQCLGGSAAAGLLSGAVQVLAGHATCVGSMTPSDDYRVVIARPATYRSLGADEAMRAETQAIRPFIETGKRWGPEIAYRMFHEALPGMKNGNIDPIGALITDYRFKMGSIENCSFLYPELIEIADALRPALVASAHAAIGLSSVGPAFFAVTRSVEGANKDFHSAGLDVVASVPLYGGTYVTK